MLVKDSGGRDEYGGGDVGIGDCTTRAIAVTMRAFNPRINYAVIRKDIIADKQKYYRSPAKRPAGSKSDYWLKTHAAVPRMTKRRLMRQYTGAIWIDAKFKKENGAPYTFEELAVRLASLESVMLVSDDHIVAVRNGLIHDTWDSKRCWATYIFCKKTDLQKVRQLLK